jgi:hypothetical protein
MMLDGYLVVYDRDGYVHVRDEYLGVILAGLRRLLPAEAAWGGADDVEGRDTLLELHTTADEPYFVRASHITSVKRSTRASRRRTDEIQAELDAIANTTKRELGVPVDSTDGAGSEQSV